MVLVPSHNPRDPRNSLHSNQRPQSNPHKDLDQQRRSRKQHPVSREWNPEFADSDGCGCEGDGDGCRSYGRRSGDGAVSLP